MEKVDLEGLRQLYSSNPAARVFLDHAASRKRNMRETTVDRILTLMNHDGHQLSRQNVIEVFKELETLGCGRFVTGRRGFPSRFEWEVGLVSVGRTASGESQDIESISDDELDDEGADEALEHTFKLRPDFEVVLELPVDLTPGEATRLADFLKTLPFGE